MRHSEIVQKGTDGGRAKSIGWALSIIVAFSACAAASKRSASFGATPHTETMRQRATDRAYKWLRGQQNPKTGLLRSYDMPGDNSASTYDQGVGILGLLAVGDMDAAVRCADAMLLMRSGRHQAWVDGYDSATRKPKAAPVAVGPNVWMGIALLQLYRAKRQAKYLSAAEQIAEFILKLQIPGGHHAGAVTGGYDENGKPLAWISTEHNADALALFAALAEATTKEEYREAAIRIGRWLNSRMWDARAKCYHVGADTVTGRVSDFPERLDSQTWTLLAQYAAAELPGWPEDVAALVHNGLLSIDPYRNEVPYEDKKLIGFPKITHGERATPSFWSEGSAGYILAARRASHDNRALGTIQDSLRMVQRANGAVPYSVGVSCSDVVELFKPSDLVVAHFESHPNCLFGQVGVYGDGAPNWDAIKGVGFKLPYSGYYEPGKPGYDQSNIQSCRQSFRLVNAGAMCVSKTKRWASLGLDLGPLINGRIRPVDVSRYAQLVFWAKTDNRDHANLTVLLRDAHAEDSMPQVRRGPVPGKLSRQWRRYFLDLNTTAPDRLKWDCELSR